MSGFGATFLLAEPLPPEAGRFGGVDRRSDEAEAASERACRCTSVVGDSFHCRVHGFDPTAKDYA